MAIRKKHDEQREEAMGEGQGPGSGDVGHAYSAGVEIQLSGRVCHGGGGSDELT